jgi:ketosteroid isomerase-like protein
MPIQKAATPKELHRLSSYAIEAGDLALLRGEWQLKGTGPDGRSLETAGNDIEVARRQADGTWRFVIDHAFGAS